jgi:hypothetical protein
MEEKLRTKKPSGKKPADSLVTSNKEGVRYPVYEMTTDGLIEPVTSGTKRVSFIAEDYGQLINASDRARQNEAIKIINKEGKEQFVPSISVFLLTNDGKIETPYGNGLFLQVPRDLITDVHWDEFAQPLTGRDEWEGYNRSKQRAAKKEPQIDFSGKKKSETMQVSTNKGQSFGDMLKSKLPKV